MDELNSESGLYGGLAEFYDKIYSFKPYPEESESLARILREEGIEDGSRLLEAACGTGAFLEHLRQWFHCEGFDLSEAMLHVAREKLPGLPLFRADMRDFGVDEPFDALLCLFSSIGHIQGDEDLLRTYDAFRSALRAGGLLIIEPWIAPEAFRPGTAHMSTYEEDDLKLCRQVVSQVEDGVAVIEMHWLVARTGGEVKHLVETYRMPLVAPQHHLELLAEAGFEARFEEEGLMPDRGLIIAKKPG